MRNTGREQGTPSQKKEFNPQSPSVRNAQQKDKGFKPQSPSVRNAQQNGLWLEAILPSKFKLC